ncbi:MAG: hypothetical protein E7675_05625 [Ruminococcaceae bacterium]|nr:hypothetical protein [Oscillospiraceae bacterium]
MKKIISLVLCIGMLMGILSIASSAEDTELVAKGSEWKYIATELLEGEAPAAAPEGWTTNTDTATWETGKAPFAGASYTSDKAQTVLFKTFKAYLKQTFTLEDASDVWALTLSITYDQDPVIYINGTEVWSAQAHYDNAYTSVDLTSFIPALKDGENTLAIEFWNPVGGGGALMDAGLTAVIGTPDPIEGGKAAVRSTDSFGSDGNEKKNPWGAIGDVVNLYDGDQNTVWGWGFEENMGIVANFFTKINVKTINLLTKDEGSMKGDTSSHGKYKIEAWVDGAWVELGTADALIEGDKLDVDVETDKIKITITSWTNNNWASIAELSFDAEEIEDEPVLPPVTGDATVFALAVATVAIFGMAVVVTKKVKE